MTAALAAVVVAGAAIAISSKKGDANAAKKGDRPPLEFSQRDVVSLQPKRLSVELAVPGLGSGSFAGDGAREAVGRGQARARA